MNAIGGGKGGKTGLYDVSILDKFNNRTYFDRRPCLTDPKHNNLFVKEQSEKEEQQIRKLIPKECFRLMGFSDNEINLDGLSDTQCYKLAGNGWDINLVSLIFKNLFGGSIECNKTMQES